MPKFGTNDAVFAIAAIAGMLIYRKFGKSIIKGVL